MSDAALSPSDGGSWRRHRRAGAVLAVLAGAAAVVVVTDPFATGSAPSAGEASSADTTALATVGRRSLSSQTQVDGTLGYAGASTVVSPSGTPPSVLHKAQQAVATATAMLRAAQTTLAIDEQALAGARTTLAADRRGAPQALAADEQQLSGATGKVAGDEGQLASAQIALKGARQDLATAASSAVAFEASASFTMLPAAGHVVHRGQALYAIDTQPTLLLYGRASVWRALRPGMSPGRDVGALNANLRALGYETAAAGDRFTAATRQGVVALQAARGLASTGRLALGAVVFKPGPVRIASVSATAGSAVQPGPVLSVTSTRHEVALHLDSAQQSQVAVGDAVTITLPDDSTTSGVVSRIGSVAAAASDRGGGGSGGTPTIEVDVRLTRAGAGGRLDKAPVHVAINTASVKRALVVPVSALLALASGGYAVEIADANRATHLTAVALGLFDDADGLVQISGRGVHAGQRVVTAAS